MQKVVRHVTLYSDFASCRQAAGSRVPPWKTKYKAKNWRPARSFSNIDEEVE